jgi:hypothetical protein
MQGMQINLLPQDPEAPTSQHRRRKVTSGSMRYGMVVTCWMLHAGKHCGVQANSGPLSQYQSGPAMQVL